MKMAVADFSMNEKVRQLACASCGKLIQINNKLIDDGETQLGSKSSAASTQLGGSASDKQACYINQNGKHYDLQIGENTIGRKASTSDADVQIETNDRYMSRNHAIINVRRLSESQIKVDLCNSRNKNTTQVNGEIVGFGESIFLHDGDTIIMGKTRMNFHFK